MRWLLLFGLVFQNAFCETVIPPQEKIPLKKVVTDIPATSYKFLQAVFSREALPAWGAVLGSSAVLYHYDDDILDGTQRTGRRWGLSNEDKTKTVVKAGQYDLLRLPSDKASALYFMGDGWLDFGVAAAFFATGSMGNHSRPYNTALQLLHGMTVSMFFDQGIKRATGRESPSDRSEPRGRWRPFPSIRAYNENTAKYDAMPSGHMMTATLMFTIIRANYPELEAYLFPTELAWLSILGFAMVNNGVHWASDYPLGIALGLGIGRASARLGRAPPPDSPTKSETAWNLMPGLYAGTATINAVRGF